MNPTESLLPFSETIERDVVGILMVSPDHIEKATELLSDAHFHHVGYLAIWKQVHALWVAGKPINDVHVGEAMKVNGTFDRIGGFSLIFDAYREGERYQGPAAKCSLAEYLPQLDTYRQARVGVEAALRLQKAAQECDLEAMQGAAEEVLRTTTTSEKKRRGVRWREIGSQWINRDVTKLKGVSTGFPWLDTNLGGLRRGALVIIAGGASDGKSSLAINIVTHVANDGNHVALFSQEMPLEENWERGLAYEKEIRSTAIRNGIFNREEHKGLTEYALGDKPIQVYDDCATMDEIAAEIRLAVLKDNVRVVVVDYLQIVDGDKKLNREQEVSEVGKRLKQLALKYQITVVAMSQLNDDGKVRESRAIKQHADQMLTIMVKEGDDTSRCIKIEKNRGGKRYIKCQYNFEGEFFAFREIGEITEREEQKPEKKAYAKNGSSRASSQFPEINR